jgi:hypothetical protein
MENPVEQKKISAYSRILIALLCGIFANWLWLFFICFAWCLLEGLSASSALRKNMYKEHGETEMPAWVKTEFAKSYLAALLTMCFQASAVKGLKYLYLYWFH